MSYVPPSARMRLILAEATTRQRLTAPPPVDPVYPVLPLDPTWPVPVPPPEMDPLLHMQKSDLLAVALDLGLAVTEDNTAAEILALLEAYTPPA